MLENLPGSKETGFNHPKQTRFLSLLSILNFWSIKKIVNLFILCIQIEVYMLTQDTDLQNPQPDEKLGWLGFSFTKI